MMTAVGNAQLNVLGWANQLLFGRRHFEKPIEMIFCVRFHSHAVENVDKQNKDQSDDNDTHLEEKEDLEQLNSRIVETNLDHRNQMDDDDDDHLDYDENVGVWKEKRLNSNEVWLQDDGYFDLFVNNRRKH